MLTSHRRLDLAAWLGSLPPTDSGHLLIGGTGHLLLSPLEQAQAAKHLQTRVLPALLSAPKPQGITLITGLAPGADLLFKRLAADWLTQADIAFEAVALLPVPVDVLIGDWVAKSHEQWTPVAAIELDAMRAKLDAMLADCDTVVDLLPDGTAPDQLQDGSFRQQQYRRLAACLAEQPDVLIALLRAQNLQQPGGTAEVVEWRRNPMRVPPEFSTLSLRRPAPGGRLMVIDPAVAVLDDWRGGDAPSGSRKQ